MDVKVIIIITSGFPQLLKTFKSGITDTLNVLLFRHATNLEKVNVDF